MRSISFAILALAVASTGCATQGAVIRGNVSPPAAGGTGATVSRAEAAKAEAVVYVARRKPAPTDRRHAAPKPSPVGPPIHVSEGPDGFTPRVIVVRPGETVLFENHDRVYHNAFSVSPVQRFDLGKIAPGAARSMKFAHPGVVRVFCDLHPAAAAWVFVAPTDAFAQPDRSGAYALPALPPGSYEVRAWHPRWGERQWSVELPRTGLALDVKF